MGKDAIRMPLSKTVEREWQSISICMLFAHGSGVRKEELEDHIRFYYEYKMKDHHFKNRIVGVG